MAFPQTPLPVHVRIYPGAQPMGAMASWPAPVDITPDVRIEQGITINYGRLNEASTVDSSDMALSIDNRAGNYTPTNPLGIYYGRLTRNTPIRISTDVVTDPFTRTTANGFGAITGTMPAISMTWSQSGTAADYATNGSQASIATPTANVFRFSTLASSNAHNSAGSVKITPPVVALGENFAGGPSLRHTDSSHVDLLQVVFNLAGVVSLRISRFFEGGFSNLQDATTPYTYTAAQQFTLRWEYNGATLLAKVWPTAGAEPAAWQMECLNSGVQEGARCGLFAYRGAANSNGTVTLLYDDLVIESIEYSGFISELPTRWDQSGRDSVVQLRASGILRRLGQGATPVKSPLFAQLAPGGDPAVVPSAYWPLEDDSGATQGANAVSGGAALGAADITFAAATDLVSSVQVVRFNSAVSKLSGVISNRLLTSGGTGFSAMVFLRFSALPGSTGTFATFGLAGNWPIGVPNRFVISLDGASVRLNGYDFTGASVVSPSAALYAIDPTKWWVMQLETDTSGLTTNYSLIWHQVGGTSYFVISGSYSNPAVARVNKVTLSSSTALSGTYIGHVWIGQNTLPFVANSFSLISNGYIGELSTDRATRVMKQDGIRGTGEYTGLETMGAQPIDTPLSILRAAETAEYGVLYEYGFGLDLRPRRSRYTPGVAMVADLASGHVQLPYEPTYDDQLLRNYVVAGRTGGVQGVVSQDPVSVAAEGKYDTTVDLNVQTDDVVAQHAAIRVYFGTVPNMRWPRVDVDLSRNGSLIPAWRQIAGVYGRRATFANPPSQAAGQVVDIIVEGYTLYMSAFDYRASLNGSPATPWDIPVYDATDARYDSATTTLSAGVTSAATSMVFSTTDPTETWSTTEAPYDVSISGETVTVTAMGAVSGTGPYLQTATVTRAVNGVAKAQTAGTQIQLARPARYAL